MPDVVPLIKSQHRDLEELLEQAEQEDSDTLLLLRRVAGLLGPHSKAEEMFVYPRIVELRADQADEVHDGTAEHHHAESLLAELLAGDPDEPGYDGRLTALIGELHHHIQEEESELLPVLSERASDDEREQLGVRFAAQTGRSEVRPDQVEAGEQSVSADAAQDATKAELYEQAKKADVPGRSSMTKEELARAVSKRTEFAGQRCDLGDGENLCEAPWGDVLFSYTRREVVQSCINLGRVRWLSASRPSVEDTVWLATCRLMRAAANTRQPPGPRAAGPSSRCGDLYADPQCSGVF